MGVGQTRRIAGVRQMQGRRMDVVVVKMPTPPDHAYHTTLQKLRVSSEMLKTQRPTND